MKTRKQLNQDFENPIKIHLTPPPTGEIAKEMLKLYNLFTGNYKNLTSATIEILKTRKLENLPTDKQSFMAYVHSAYKLNKKEWIEAEAIINWLNFIEE